MEHDLATTADLTNDAAILRPTEPITGWHALQGLPIGVLRGMMPGTDLQIAVDTVIEEAADLAVADRVAYIMSSRTGRQHVVLASTNGYLVATLSTDLDWAGAMRLEPGSYAPRIVSVASAEGVLPLLTQVA